MKHKEKFLTIYAVFDDETQSQLKDWQSAILQSGLQGSQSMDIPFHISLGSFSVENKEKLIVLLQNACAKYSSFTVDLLSIKKFNNRVLYIEPSVPSELINLHCIFDSNYADGLPYVPHTTIFIGNDNEVAISENILLQCFSPIKATVTEIHLCEFFPAKFITKIELNKHL